MTAAAAPELYALDLEGGGRLAVTRDLADPRGLVVSLTTLPVAIAGRVPRLAIQHLIQALDDFLYDSRP